MINPYISPGISFFGSAFSLAGWVGQGKNDRARVLFGHGLDDLFGESSTDGGGSNESMWFDILDQLKKIFSFWDVLGEGFMTRIHFLSVLGDDSINVHQVNVVTGIFVAEAFTFHVSDTHFSDTSGSSSGPQKDVFGVLHLTFVHSGGSQETGNDNRGSSLDVIVEHTVLIGITVQKTVGVGISKVFELNQRVLAVSKHKITITTPL